MAGTPTNLLFPGTNGDLLGRHVRLVGREVGIDPPGSFGCAAGAVPVVGLVGRLLLVDVGGQRPAEGEADQRGGGGHGGGAKG